MHYKNTNYIGTDQKRCTTCKEVRPLTEFVRSARDGHGPQCRKCASARTGAWARKNKDRANANSRRSHAKHPETQKKAAEARKGRVAQLAQTGIFPAEKACNRCGEVKPLNDFRKSKTSPDGRNTICAACDAKRVREWKDARRDKVREQGRARYRANPEAGRAASAKWREKNREKSLEANRAAYRRNAEKVAAYHKRRYEENPELYRAKASNWAKSHREQANEAKRRRKQRKKGLPGSHTVAEWKALCAKFGNRCVCCGEKGKLTRDHVIPVTKPGSSDFIENIQPLCQKCNCNKHNNHTADYRKTPFVNRGQLVLFT